VRASIVRSVPCAFLLFACSVSGGGVSDEAVSRGRELWAARCANCHGPDPAKAGPLGPPVAGSARALVEARVLHAQYPAGYTPQRTTTLMIAMPDLADSIDDLTAFLGSER
jgi:mono/diheme cytochrome c family protein